MVVFPRYSIFARHVPAMVTVIPMAAFYFLFLRRDFGEILNFVVEFWVLKDVSVLFALFFVFWNIGRGIGKYVFENSLYSDGKEFPTTQLLSWENSFFSEVFKKKIYRKIESDFGIYLPTLKEAKKNPEEAKKRIREAVGQIKSKIKNGRLVLDRNIEYGLCRNIVGGSMLALFVSLLGVSFSQAWSAPFFLFWIFVCFFEIPILFSRQILWKYGKNYAETLFEEYLASK